MILPFLDASPFYSWINFNKSWDNPYNSYVLNSSIPTYMVPGVDALFTRKGYGLTHIQGNPNLFYRNSSVKLRQMKNGAKHNWFAGEVAGEFQPWGYPFNWRTLGTKMCNGPGGYGRPVWYGGHLLLADGSVSFFSDETSLEILKSLASSPPVATQIQTMKPTRIFKTGDFNWKRINLYSNPAGPNTYFANVLVSKWGKPLVIKLFYDVKLTPEQLEYIKMYLKSPRFFLQIDASTDIAKELKGTLLFKATSPGQFQANVKKLQAIQKQLQ